MSDTFSENDKGFENTTETSHARYQHHSQTSNRKSCLNFTENTCFSQNLAYLSNSNIALNQQVNTKCDLLRKNEFSIQP